jgi:hypothetical protein
LQMARARRNDQDLWDRFWKNRDGDVVIYQHPNIPLIAWLVLTIASIFLTGTVSNVIWYIAMGALAIWALLEIWKGVNYFRRALGVIILIMTILAFFKVGY